VNLHRWLTLAHHWKREEGREKKTIQGKKKGGGRSSAIPAAHLDHFVSCKLRGKKEKRRGGRGNRGEKGKKGGARFSGLSIANPSVTPASNRVAVEEKEKKKVR